MASKRLTVAHAGVAEGKEPVPTEVIAESIVSISQGIKKLRSGSLHDKALLLLLAHASGVSQIKCKLVLDGLENLESQFIRKKGR